VDIVKFLLEKKADVNVKGPDGRTAKQAAADRPEIAALFK
jgi:ankyrin repeat protein